MELVVHKISGEATDRKVTLHDDVFGIEPNDHAIYLDTKQFLANQRQGTHKSKERNEIAGSTRKIKKQKSTGTARAGSIKSPLFVGGGRVFGPQPRDYSFKLNKKVKRLARKSALSYKAKELEIVILEDFSFEGPKTKNFVNILNSFDLQGAKSLFVMPKADQNVVLSSRNLQRTKVVTANSLNTYDILNAKKLFVLESSLKTIEEILA
ncbi:MAG: 50S ribosomal protein L4 [Bacteroidales bacterium]|jgi:large subunit ribosomal protein L4|nr:50S ribosomal protein L4 [Bacteroidales bacterium]MDN5348847.1 large subunit ribosomal protein [Bacteroidales bacterium]